MKIAAHDGLYDTAEDPPRLRGVRCDACGAVAFPPFGIGCEVCGSDAIGTVSLAGAGTVHSVATVHLHGGKDIDAPFTIAEIQLDDGPLIRATLVELVEPDAIGSRAEARWCVVRVDEDGNDVVEPRFAVTT